VGVAVTTLGGPGVTVSEVEVEETTTVGIVGHEAAKFTPGMESLARATIWKILEDCAEPLTVISGGCHLGGIDVWAMQEARLLGFTTMEFKPQTLSWEHGYKPRNIQIAEWSAILHVIVVKDYPPGFTGMTFTRKVAGGGVKPFCYHCKSFRHVKSGGCWTGKYAQRLGKPVVWWEL
jgi:hypothetical protein